MKRQAQTSKKLPAYLNHFTLLPFHPKISHLVYIVFFNFYLFFSPNHLFSFFLFSFFLSFSFSSSVLSVFLWILSLCKFIYSKSIVLYNLQFLGGELFHFFDILMIMCNDVFCNFVCSSPSVEVQNVDVMLWNSS